MLRQILTFLRREIPLLAIALIALAFLLTGRVSLVTARKAIDVDLLLVLFALLIAVEMLRESGWLDRIVAMTVSRFRHSRPFVLVLIVASGALASLVTNDVALFVVIPFTIAASRVSPFDAEVAVILEIVAANLLGCLTPLGNPQNLFVFHRSGWSAGTFIITMLPFVAVSAVGLIGALFLLRVSGELKPVHAPLPERRNAIAVAGAVVFLLVLLEIARVANAWPAAIAAAVVAVVFLRRRLFAIDFSIIPLFFFAFIAVEGLRTLNVYRLLDGLPLPSIAAKTYVASLVLSQVMSNVPATVLLAPFAAGAWKTLLYGVNAGGCGTIIASLANLLGWRIYVRESNRDPRFFRRLTAINFAFLAWIAAAAWLVL